MIVTNMFSLVNKTKNNVILHKNMNFNDIDTVDERFVNVEIHKRWKLLMKNTRMLNSLTVKIVDEKYINVEIH